MPPNFTGTWKMKSSENFDELLKALGNISFHLTSQEMFETRFGSPGRCYRTLFCTAKNSWKEMTQEARPIKCTNGRSLAMWETENKIYCKQTLVAQDGPVTYWSRELRGDELILVRDTNTPYHRQDFLQDFFI
uniref:Cellular retinoic acid binding protein 1a n=1 Tax=Sinocyclocheilus grahami TaxID=75366 RepID=A0A672Q1Y4_SINGR